MLCQPALDAQVSARTEALLRARATLRATARLSRLVPAGGDELQAEMSCGACVRERARGSAAKWVLAAHTSNMDIQCLGGCMFMTSARATRAYTTANRKFVGDRF